MMHPNKPRSRPPFTEFGPGPERVRRHRHGRRGGPGWGPDFGPGFGFGPGGRRGGPRARRGDVRHAIIDVLAKADDKLNGYMVIQAIAERTDGAWKASPGSIYPTVAQLEDEGLVEISHEGGRKVLGLTPDGRNYAEENAEEIAAVWTSFEEGSDSVASVMRQVKQLMGAISQVMATGTPAQQEQALTVISSARRELYTILAEDADS